MSATLNERVPSAPAIKPAANRVAIREVREVTFRALVAAGASNAEAKVAAEQVLFTELHRGSGLSALLADVSTGPWTRSGLACERDSSGPRPVLRVAGPGRHGALRQGALLVDLLAAEPELDAVVVSEGLTSLSPLLDESLIRAARTTGCWMVAADRSAASLNFRVASPDGGIGVGMGGADGRLDPDSEPLPSGVSLTRRDKTPRAPIAWLTASEQQATRAVAAQQGRLVDSAVWADATAAAKAYLVEDQ